MHSRIIRQPLRRLLQLSVFAVDKELADLNEKVLHSMLPRPVLDDALHIDAALRVHKRIVDFGLKECLGCLVGVVGSAAHDEVENTVVNRTVLRSDDGALPIGERDVVRHDQPVTNRHVGRALLRLLELLEEHKVAWDDDCLPAHRL